MKDFENAGYKKFLQPPETIRSADFGLQKLFSDTTGKKYYVTIELSFKPIIEYKKKLASQSASSALESER